ncbi:MAG: TonB C-terminal domain-containing protein [Bryobacterales bacterium]|nr:TonB C-terminal domain-containing protein [Bryobacterales bacterium]
MEMVAYAEEFDRDQHLRKPLLASLTFHLLVTGTVVFWTWWANRAKDTFGDPNSIGGAATITTVDTIPMPHREGITNKVANDTESMVPERTKQEVKREEKEEPDAVPLERTRKNKRQRKKKVAAMERRYTPEPEYRPNRLSSSTGAAMATPMYSIPGGGGGIGIGAGSPFGTHLGWYADLIRQRVGEKWRTQNLDPRLNSARVVIVNFDIQRNGEVTNLRLVQTSGNYGLDQSTLRAVQEASPLPQLPAEFTRNKANVEFQFQFKR